MKINSILPTKSTQKSSKETNQTFTSRNFDPTNFLKKDEKETENFFYFSVFNFLGAVFQQDLQVTAVTCTKKKNPLVRILIVHIFCPNLQISVI
uniref:hypothetical protein n=1 Tax=Enterococcus faecium TaxID=1352 RepID=UPI003F4EAD6F